MKFMMTVFAVAMMTTPVMAEEGVKAEVKEAAQDAVKNTKKAARKADNEICETINGTLKCIPKKINNAGKNAADEIKDKTH